MEENRVREPSQHLLHGLLGRKRGFMVMQKGNSLSTLHTFLLSSMQLMHPTCSKRLMESCRTVLSSCVFSPVG